MTQLDANKEGRTRRYTKAFKAKKRDAGESGEESPPPQRKAPAVAEVGAEEPPIARHYQRKSDDALDRLVRSHVSSGGSFDEVLDLLDSQGRPQVWSCPMCDEHGSESKAHTPGCCARSISKKKGGCW
ncbi:hypothetical protein GCM10010313_20570 [Streptomyces violarus]|uniref:Uncharacterized protein n=1 Tax=Streptomyces violarus TaxID=67380 RepID=A0A7W4ZN46_9ACTN|nr:MULTISPECIES: hypothetical protein [Streptomyces]MBB3075581.1 hypothetical protein [Streptomyces violarus]WRT98172.1 hypothetical protein VJ737_10960 [Streptomyces sp. CGMCC 4.1772]GHD04365.1 hypothetical protein GCM10010313_20570 [Streptomyces violarus]